MELRLIRLIQSANSSRLVALYPVGNTKLTDFRKSNSSPSGAKIPFKRGRFFRESSITLISAPLMDLMLGGSMLPIAASASPRRSSPSVSAAQQAQSLAGSGARY